jgi:hypothetical protein
LRGGQRRGEERIRHRQRQRGRADHSAREAVLRHQAHELPLAPRLRPPPPVTPKSHDQGLARGDKSPHFRNTGYNRAREVWRASRNGRVS